MQRGEAARAGHGDAPLVAAHGCPAQQQLHLRGVLFQDWRQECWGIGMLHMCTEAGRHPQGEKEMKRDISSVERHQFHCDLPHHWFVPQIRNCIGWLSATMTVDAEQKQQLSRNS